jgi:hypothetical protein
MTVGRVDAAAAPLPDGRVLVAGGIDPTDFTHTAVLRSAEIFDPATETFSPTGSMTIPREDAGAAPLPDGRVLVAGGKDEIHNSLQSAEIFDPVTGTFAPTGDLTIARGGPAAAPLPDGRVLVAGGDYERSFEPHVSLQSAEIFDPRTGSFAPTGSMTVPRAGAAAAAPLPNGGVLVAGGAGPLPLTSAEIFDAATGKFTPTGNLNVERASAAAAPLPDGRVLVAGGGAPLGQGAEIFDPVTGTFGLTEYMNTGRYGAAAAPLSDGRVLVAGTNVGFGSEALRATRSAELFTPGLSYRLKGTRLIVPVAVAGTLAAADASQGPGGSAAAAGKRRLLKSTSAHGGPRPIALTLRPTASGRRRLERKGKLKVRATVHFAPAPVQGECVTAFSPCYSRGYAISETLTLKLKAKRRKRSPRPDSTTPRGRPHHRALLR